MHTVIVQSFIFTSLFPVWSQRDGTCSSRPPGGWGRNGPVLLAGRLGSVRPSQGGGGGGSEGYGRAAWFGSGAGGAGIAVLLGGGTRAARRPRSVTYSGEPFLSAAFQEVAAGGGPPSGRRRFGHAGLPCRVQGPDQNTILLCRCAYQH